MCACVYVRVRMCVHGLTHFHVYQVVIMFVCMQMSVEVRI